ncbi:MULTISPECIES: hypothetical protein [Halococcus]|uniref:Uncharacterized protein n=1 Tax=Halococcus salifodinae DSM 8989 TaxID=1227456 RepID=M0N763_9EURY|nr:MULTISPECIES: hypothetical protein [Halococcus]EMA53398.1 hypothetical protein C450_08797 [Halococcus salifodinae DSM 8989]
MSQREMQPSTGIEGRFTEWFRNRPTSLEFWEVLIGEDRLACCFAGESFSSHLLRADMGESTRRALDDCSTIEAAVGLDERNFVVPLSSVTVLRLRKGTRTRRARLTLAWDDAEGETSWTLSNTNRGDEQADLVEILAERDALAEAEVEIESPRLAFL